MKNFDQDSIIAGLIMIIIILVLVIVGINDARAEMVTVVPATEVVEKSEEKITIKFTEAEAEVVTPVKLLEVGRKELVSKTVGEPVIDSVEADEVTQEIEENGSEAIVEPETRYYDIPLSEDLQNHIFDLCDRYGVDASMVISIIDMESGFRDWVIGDNGKSFGLMQVQPKWHSGRMARLGCEDLLDPYDNVHVGIDYFAEMIAEGKGIEWALMAYNGGENYADDMAEDEVVSEYAKTVIGNRDIFEECKI